MGPFCVFAGRVQTGEGEEFHLKRRYDEAVAGRRVLVVDDIINTGHSTGLVLKAVKAAGGDVIAVATWINRGNVGAEAFGVDTFIHLDEVHLPSFPAAGCRLCAESIPVNTDYAHGAEFLAGA